jgi:hypothetical protein
MFAHSYDPLGYEHQQLQLSPNPDEKRRRQERSRRRRMIEADRRRREVMEWMLLSEEEAYRRHPGGLFPRNCSEPSLQYLRHGEWRPPPPALRSPASISRHSPLGTGDPLVGAIPVPAFIYAQSVSASQDDMDRNIENHPPSRPVDSRARHGCGDADSVSSSSSPSSSSSSYAVLREKSQRKSQASGNRPSKDVEPLRMDVGDDDCDDPTAPPHIIAKEDTSDDEDKDLDDLYTIWGPR